MKINVGKFGALISWLSFVGNHTFDAYQCSELMEKVNDLEVVETEPYRPLTADCYLLDQLLGLMRESTRKIEAIKVHRQLTGLGLKESKDAVEKYWVSKLENSS